MNLSEEEDNEEQCKLFDLPLCALRLLLSYLDSTSLYMLSQTCTYLKECVEDPMCWRYVDGRSPPHNIKKNDYFLERVNEKTRHLLLSLSGGPITTDFFIKINPFKNLVVLSLESQKINASKITMRNFPSSLEELCLKKTILKTKNSSGFFQHSSNNMRKLRVLILDECAWLTSSFLMSVSKYENLEIISVVKCTRVHLQTVPYLNVAKYGCKKLKIFDCRFTGIGGELLRTFFSRSSIQRFYFQSFNSSSVDYNISFMNEMKSMQSVTTDRVSHISDSSLADYALVQLSDSIEPIHGSMLYRDPYPECTCGYKNLEEERTVTDIKVLGDDIINDISRNVTKFVCKKHVKDVTKLPSEFKEFFISHQQQFYSEYDSNSDSDSSDSDSDDHDNNCCIYGMGSKIVLSYPTVNNQEISQEFVLPQRSPGPFNIFFVNPLSQRNNNNDNNNNGENSQRTRNDLPSTSRDVPQNNQLDNKKEADLKRKNVDDEIEPGPCKRICSDVKDVEPGSSNPKNNVYEVEPDPNKRNGNDDGVEPGPSKKTGNDDGVEPGPSNRKGNDDDVEPGPSKRKSNADGVKPGPSKRKSNDDGVKPGPSKRKNNDDGVKPGPSKKIRRQAEALSLFFGPHRIRPEEALSSGPRRGSPSRQLNKDKKRRSKPDGAKNDMIYAEVVFGGANNPNFRPNAILIPEANNPPFPPRAQVDNNNSRIIRIDGPSTSNREGGPPINVNVVVERPRYVCARLIHGGDFNQVNRNNSPERHVFRNRMNFLEVECVKQKISLRRLSLRGYPRVTDVTLNHLKHLNLELLDLTYTSVTKDGIEMFLIFNPNCRIIHPLYCICKPNEPF